MSNQQPQQPAPPSSDPLYAVYRREKNDPEGNRKRRQEAMQRMLQEVNQRHAAPAPSPASGNP